MTEEPNLMACDINQSKKTLDLLEGTHFYWTQKCHIHICCVGMYGENGASRGNLEASQVRMSSTCKISPQLEDRAIDTNRSSPTQILGMIR